MIDSIRSGYSQIKGSNGVSAVKYETGNNEMKKVKDSFCSSYSSDISFDRKEKLPKIKTVAMGIAGSVGGAFLGIAAGAVTGGMLSAAILGVAGVVTGFVAGLIAATPAGYPHFHNLG